MRFEEEFDKGLKELKEALQRRPDIKLFIILDAPWTEAYNGHMGDFDPLQHIHRWRHIDRVIAPLPKSDRWKRGNEAITKALKGYAHFLDPQPYVCPGQKCDLLNWYRDDDHLQSKRILTDGVWLDTVFK